VRIVHEIGGDSAMLPEIHRYVRLSHWAAFEEPKKRYIIEGGIVDYLFRELAFQRLIQTGIDSPVLRNKKFCLEVNQQEFLELLGSLNV